MFRFLVDLEVMVYCKYPVLYFGVALLFVASLFLSPAVPQVAAEGLPPGATALFPSPNERFGFGVLYGIANYDVTPLTAGWYQNWSTATGAAHPGSAMAVHVARVTPQGLQLDPATAQRIADEDPGALWVIGNEPDMAKQDNVTPAQYAAQYRQAYFMIKGYDPTAQVAAGGIVQPSPLRLGWLSAAWDAYQQLYGSPMPADVWNIHNYILQELPGEWGCGMPPGFGGERPATYPFNSHDDLTIFQDHVRAMRQWMADHGQRNKPLIITEYGILFPDTSGYDLTRVRNFFTDTANWLLTASDPLLGDPADDNHLVQRWMWYSLDDTNFNNAGNTVAALMDSATRQMRPMGQAFANLVTPLRRPYVNLVVGRVQMQSADAGAVSLHTSQPVVVRATIQNRGNTAAAQAFRVVITDQTGALVHAETVNGLPARYGGDAVVQTNWQKPAGTDWRLFVRVDLEGAIAESDESDNEWVFSPAADVDVASFTVQGLSGWGSGQPSSASLDVTALVQNRNGVTLSGIVVRLWDGSQLLDQRTLTDLAPGAQVEVTFPWPNAVIGLHALAVDAVLPPGISDPVPDNNRIGRDVLLAGQRSYLPVVNGPQFQSGQTVGVQCRNALANPGFESGDLNGWTATPFADVMSAGCFDGTYCLWLGRGMNIEDDVYQTVSVKPWASAHLNFAWAIVTTETAPESRDTLAVEIRSAAGQLLRTVQALDNRDAHPYWYTADVNLNDFAGQSIQLHFRARNDAANPTNFFVDKVNLEVCEKR